MTPAAADAGMYAAMVKWRPSTDPAVTGYRVYKRLAGSAYGTGQDVGTPAPGSDGSLAVQLSNLDVRSDYVFAVTAYEATTESGLSNEIPSGYAQVAPLVDSDGDGLKDAAEDVNLNRIVDAGETDPNKADTDGDGVRDATDTCRGTPAGAAVNASGCACSQVTCTDGNACNGVETCTAGVCGPGTPPNCDDGNACTTDACAPATGCTHAAIAGCVPCTTAAQCADTNPCSTDTCTAGRCAHATAPNGTACSDGNACNGAEICQSGACTAGTALVCNDGNPCTTDSCNPASGCVFAPNTNPCADDGNVCTIDVCGGGACTHPAVPNGTSCTDGNACNGVEACTAGVCGPGTPPNCDDGNACTTDACAPATGCTHAAIAGCVPCTTAAQCADTNPCSTDTCTAGRCAHAAAPNGTACSDGNACNGAETCQSGACTAGTALVCNDGNPCTTDSCNPASGCVFAPNTNPCADDGNVCTDDVCGGGACTHPAVPNGTSCADANVCDGEETCQSGRCSAVPALDCNDGNACTTDSCSPTTGCAHAAIPGCTACTTAAQCGDGNPCTADACTGGVCQYTAAPNGTACSDGNACNGAETCQSGTCTAGTALVCSDGNPCTTDSCNPASGCVFAPNTNPCADDGNVCTADVCGGGSCTHPPVANGTACSDGDVCDGAETCQGGSCSPGAALNCSDADACTTDSCAPATGCAHTPIPGCSGCTGDAQCNDGNPCTVDSCSGGTCQHSTAADGASCGDGNLCNGAETCRGGTCRPGTALVCNDGNACTNDSCNPSSGCVATNNTNPCPDDGNACTNDVCAGGSCTHPAKVDGTACGDGNVCNGAEICQAGSCRTATAPTCNDSNPCTTDSCDPTTGCVFTPNTAACADDTDPCTADVCAAGACTHPPKPNGTPCSDSLFCTVNETCQAGVCTGGGTNCTQYGLPCKASGCDERRRNCYLTIKPNGTPCGDTDACNGTDTCQKGNCVPGRAPDCDDHNPCTTDSCSPAIGCVHTSIADGTPCSDGIFCNGAETCAAGRCVAPPTPVCDDGNACTADVCVERDKRCRHDGVDACCLTDADCADEDACTIGERCEAGRCTSDAVVCPAAEEVCHEAVCDATRGCLTTAVRDGTECDDGDPCTRGDACTAGVCGPTSRNLGATPIGGLAVTKFVLQPAGRRGLRLTAQGYFVAQGLVDPVASGARLEILGGQGRVLLVLDLAGSAFKANPVRTRFVSVPARGSQAALAGLKRLDLRVNGPTVDVAVKGLLPPAVADVAANQSSAAAGTSDSTVAWAIWLGEDCVSDPSLHCDGKSSAKRCR